MAPSFVFVSAGLRNTVKVSEKDVDSELGTTGVI